jgi:hypothetical protein
VVSISLSHQVRNAELCVGIHCNPSPHVTRPERLPFLGYILSFRVAEIPNLITLHMARSNISDVAIVILGTDCAEVNEQFQDRILANARHANGCTN